MRKFTNPYSRFKPDELFLRDELAIDRTLLANERTFLAYLRTAVAFVLAGVTFIHFARSSWYEMLGFVCVPIGILILITARIFVPYEIAHPFWMFGFLVLTAITFSLFGFIIGVWADGFEKLQIVPLMIVTPLTFLGGSFYSINMLPPLWQKITLFNPVVYLISCFRWSFYGVSDVNVLLSLGMTLLFLVTCLVIIWWIFKTGYKLKS